MGNYDWEKVETIIDQVLELPVEQHEAYLNKKCVGDKKLKRNITQLLNAIFDSEGWLEKPGEYKRDFYSDISEGIEQLPSDYSLIGQQIASYTIKEKLGEGGMGSVYLAERSDGSFEHRVAIKIIRRGRATETNLRRFEREQHILAQLNHPGIAQLYDGGITPDGFPYIIMEYIDGTPIDEYCQINNCSANDIIELFTDVLEAVRNAHENLVVHRDLKPDNILIDNSGSVKILDFGISKLLNEEGPSAMLTQTGARLLTPRYASPEQIRQKNITTSVDLYALGIILYELLTKTFPFSFDELTPYEVEQTILNESPAKPSSKAKTTNARKQLHGDLDAIILKAIRKDPMGRYRGITEFLDDLSNWQQNLPVDARKGSTTYRVNKLLKRHKKGFAAAAGVSLLFGVLIGFYTWRISQKRNQAELEAKKSAAVTNFLTQLIEANAPSKAQGDTVSIRDFLENGFDKVQNLNKTPLVQAEVLTTMGHTYRSLGDIQKASTLINKALTILKLEHIENQKIAQSYNVYGIIQRDLGNYGKSKQALQRSVDMYRRLELENTSNFIKSLRDLAYVERLQANYSNALSHIQEALKISSTLYDEPNVKTAETLFVYASILRFQKKYKEALKIQKQSLEMVRTIKEGPHPGIALNLVNLANLYNINGENAKAIRLSRSALQMSKKLYGGEHQEIANISGNLSGYYLDAVELDSAEYYLKKAIKIQQKINPENPRLGNFYVKYAKIYFIKEQFKFAGSFLKKAQRTLEKSMTENHPTMINIKANEAELAVKQNKLGKAQKLISEISQNEPDKLNTPLKKKVERLKKLISKNETDLF